MANEFRFRIVPELDEAAVARAKNNLKFPDARLKIDLDVTALKDKLVKLQSDYAANKQVIREINAELKVGAVLTDAQKQAYERAKVASAQQKQEIAETKKLIAEATARAGELKKSFEGVGTITEDMATRFAKVGLALQGFQQISATFDQFLVPYQEFDKQLRNIGTLGVKNFAEFKDAAMELASQVPDSVAGVTEAVYNAISAGAIRVVDGQAQVAEGMKFVETASKLAVAGLTDTNAAVKSLAAVTNAYGSDVLGAGQAADILFGIVKYGVTTVPELNAALANVVPIAASVGVSFEEVGAAMATLTKAGVPTAQATTQIRAAIAELAKPGANLSKVMKEAGVSLETLKAEGLQVTMAKLGEAMSRMGTDAANTFSSIEAVSYAMSVTGDNAAKAAADVAAIKASAGSVDEAFAVASEGIENQVTRVTKQVQMLVFGAFDQIGKSAVVAMSSMNQLAPTLMGFASLKTIIPGAIGNVKNFAQNIASKLVPSLTAATAGQKSLNLAILANPYVIAAASLAGLVAGLHFLSDALHDTAKERLASANAEAEVLKTQVQINQQQMSVVESNISLVEQFRKQGESAMQNKSLLLDLARTYPGVIDMTKSYAENLANLDKASEANRGRLSDLRKEMSDLMTKQYQLDVKVAFLKVDTAKEDIENLLTDAQSGLLNKAAEFVFGTSTARKQAEDMVKEYTDAIYKAKDDKEIQQKVMEFQMALFNDKRFAEIDPKTKQAVVGKIQEMGEAQREALKKVQQDIASDWERGLQMGYSEARMIDMMAEKYNKSKKEIREMVERQKESKSITDSQAQAVRDLAGAWDAVRQKTDEAIKQQLAEANALLLKTRTEKLSDADKKRIQEEYNLKIQSLREQVKAKKQLDAIDEETQIKAGLRQKQVSKATADNILQEYEAAKNKWQQQLKINELARENARLESGVPKTAKDDVAAQVEKLNLLEQQKQKLIEIAAKYGGKVEGDKIVNLKLDKNNKERLLSEFDKLNNEINEAKLVKEGFEIKAKIEDTKFNEQMAEIERKTKEREVEFKYKVGLITATDYHLETMNLLSGDIDRLRSKVDEINNEKVKFSYDKAKLIELENELTKVQDEIAKKQEEINKTYAEYVNAQVMDNINAIKDSLERERRLRLRENAITLREQLSQTKDNRVKQLALIEEFAAKEAAINREYNEKTSSEMMRTINIFAQSLKDETKKMKFEVDDSQAKAKLEENAKSLAELDKAFRQGELSYANYVKDLNKIEEERIRITKERNDDFAKAFSEAFSNALQASIDAANAGLAASMEAYQDAFDKIRVLKEQAKSTFDAEELEVIYQKIDDLSQKAADSMSQMWQQVGDVAALTFGQMIATGKSFQKSMVLAMLAGLKASVPIIVAKILGKELSEKGLLGIATSAALSALFYAAIAKAEAAARAAKFEKGGEIVGGEQLIRVNERGTEFVVNHIAYAKNKRILQEINRRNITIEQYAREKGLIAAKNEIKIDTSRLESRLESVERAVEEVEMAIHNTIRRDETYVKMEFNDKELVQRYDVFRRNKLRRW